MAFTVIVKPRAVSQIRDAVAWWREHRLAARGLLVEELAVLFWRLADQPHVGRAVKRRHVRRAVLSESGYVAFYRVRPRSQRVEVLAFWHPRRGNPPGGDRGF